MVEVLADTKIEEPPPNVTHCFYDFQNPKGHED